MRTKRNLVIFIIVTLASGWLGTLFDSILKDQPKGNSLGMGLWLITPLITSIVLRIISRDSKDLGINPKFKGNLKWYLLGMGIYPLITVITIGLASLFGLADFSNFKADTFLSLALTSTLINLVRNIFEEFSWRGYLLPKLMDLNINDWVVNLITGLVWALWHAAYYLVYLPDGQFESISRVEWFIIASILMLCWTIMFNELFRITKSVWPCVVMHAFEDAFPTVLVTTSGFITFIKPGDVFFNPIYGIAATLLILGIGLWLRSVRIRKTARMKMILERSN